MKDEIQNRFVVFGMEKPEERSYNIDIYIKHELDVGTNSPAFAIHPIHFLCICSHTEMPKLINSSDR